MSPLELWGGVECTVNRVGDSFHSQLALSGHAQRLGDLERIAELGIRTLRYPVLWELTDPGGGVADWRWPDTRLERLRTLGIAPIVGLVHHGSGPARTHLLDEGFAAGLARYAGMVADRYPWVEWYTPVNEPLTTARFSALYGHWYPHARDGRSFLRALINEVRGTTLAMRAIRRVNPHAKLVQTDDLGRVYGTAKLAYQVRFENERRWLTWDLLCGRVDRSHPLWRYLLANGIVRGELEWFLDNPCPPDLIGINHYLTSDRFLDPRLHLYERGLWGGNGRHRYVDVEAVRTPARPADNLRRLLLETWRRYRIPLAVTEAHLGCSREEQMRWLCEVWQQAQAARARGAQVRAVTAWALFGSFDWNSLLTRFSGHYEAGVFDVRGGASPRRTALGQVARALARGEAPSHPALAGPGWWRRPERLLRRRSHRLGAGIEAGASTQHGPPLLITGATGTLGRAFSRICELRGLAHRLCTRERMDICEPSSIDATLDEVQPWAVVNAAGYVRVDDAERDRDRCYRENTLGPELLARACARHGIPFLTFSSDLVFDGRREEPYVESEPVRPLSVYGDSKARAEAAVLERHPRALVVRTSSFFGPWDVHNFLTIALRTLAEGRRFTALDDVVVSPTYVPDLVNASLDLLVDGEQGLWHVTNEGALTWADFARRGAELAGIDVRGLDTCTLRSLALPAPRPAFSALTSERAVLLPALSDAMTRYLTATALGQERSQTCLGLATGARAA